MARYDGAFVKKECSGKRYFRGLKYPDIPVSDNDIYFISAFGDTLDVIANDYYKNTDDYWVIAIANNLRCDSRFMPLGTQVRVPADITGIKASFNKLNGIV